MVGTGQVGLLPADPLFVQQVQSPLNNEVMLLCRARLPEEHPLCAATATSSICQQADRLALLHSRLRTGQPTQANSFVVQPSNLRRGFLADINPQGEGRHSIRLPVMHL